MQGSALTTELLAGTRHSASSQLIPLTLEVTEQDVAWNFRISRTVALMRGDHIALPYDSTPWVAISANTSGAFTISASPSSLVASHIYSEEPSSYLVQGTHPFTA